MVALRHLVVLIPGMGGSVLSDPRLAVDAAAGGAASSGRARFAITPAALARAVVAPADLDIDRYPRLVSTDLVTGLTVVPGLLVLPGYGRLNLHLRNTFGDVGISTYQPEVGPVHPDTDVLRFPYDFRQSIETTAQRLDEAVDEALRVRGGGPQRPVIVVAHSMGGLVARFWLGVLGGWRHCAALVTMGTPYRGAPKALDWLINGVGAGALRLRRMARIVRAWPSAYELLPQYEAVWNADAGAAVELTSLPPPMRSRSRDLDTYADRFERMAAAGRRVHERMRQAWENLDPRQAPQLVAFLGRGHATPNLATLAGGRLRVTKDDPPWRGNVGWAGDGTVPMLCAIPPELGARQDLWRVAPDRHGELAELAAAIEQVSLYEGEPLPIRGGPEPDHPWLGLDLDDITTADVDIPIGARLLPGTLAGQRAVVTLTPRDGTPGQVYRDALNRVSDPAGGSAWQGAVPPRPAGSYEIAVEVTGVPERGSVAASATLVVFDRDDLDRLDRAEDDRDANNRDVADRDAGGVDA